MSDIFFISKGLLWCCWSAVGTVELVFITAIASRPLLKFSVALEVHHGRLHHLAIIQWEEVIRVLMDVSSCVCHPFAVL